LRQLEEDLGIDLSKAQIMRLEFGLNLNLPDCTTANQLLNNILVYKGKIPNYITYENDGLMCHFNFNEFDIKIYDKGVQHGKGGHYLRYELVIKKKHYFDRRGILNASDLFNRPKLLTLNNELIKTSSHLIFYDHELPRYNLTNKQQSFFFEYGNAIRTCPLLHEEVPFTGKKKNQK
jgi:hypothetical protein